MKTKTSETSPIIINQVVPPSNQNQGWVAITLAPGKKTTGTYNYWDRDLDTDLARLKDQGTTTLVPLIEDDELVRLKIPNLVESAQTRGLEVIRFPFHDGGVPKDITKTINFVKGLCARYGKGERIVMHCNGGLGRAGTMAACLRLALDLDKSPEQAIQSVRKARGPRAIETKAQEEFIGFFGRTWKQGRESLVLSEEDRRRGAWYGLAVGDALGAPVEFMSANQIKQQYGRWEEMQAGGPWEKGEWTDDTALAIANASAYREGFFDLFGCADSMVEWLQSKPKDVGNQTRMALGLRAEGYDVYSWPGEMLARKPGGAGNGSLMRAAPTGLVRKPDDPHLIEETIELSRLTHPDERCIDSCIAFNFVLSSLVHDNGNVEKAFEAAIAALDQRNQEVLELVKDISLRNHWNLRYARKPIGYVLVCLEYALTAAKLATGYEEGVLTVIHQGGDTDTNAAVAGALLGAKFGYDQIPRRWLDPLLDRDQLDQAYQWIQQVKLKKD